MKLPNVPIIPDFRLTGEVSSRSFKIFFKLCTKKIYQRLIQYLQRIKISLNLINISDERFLRRSSANFSNKDELISYLEVCKHSLLYWNTKYQFKLVQLIGDYYPLAISNTIQEADKICQHVFDLLGSGPVNLGRAIDWHQDFKSGYRWPTRFYADISQVPNVNHADVKVPRELSRCHHFVTLGKAYWYTQNEIYASEFVSQLTDWIERNPPRMTVNWCSPMDVAIRMINWIWAYYLFRESSHFDVDRKMALLKSLFSHGQFIRENLEYYGEYSDNHYLSNVVGLLFAGVLFPEFKAAKRWRKFAVNALFTEISMQVHEDGVHFEGSIGYHRLVLEMFASALILCEKNKVEIPSLVWNRLEKMFEFVLYYTKPDGSSPQIGDTDNGRLQMLGQTEIHDHRYLLAIGAVLFERADFKEAAGGFHEDALWLLGEAGLDKFNSIQGTKNPTGSQSFKNSGFYFMRNEKLYMAVHCSSNGRRGIGNHCHNDMLSFELFAYDKTFIVDPGTYVYTADPQWRNLFRSTSYHNTVRIDGVEINQITDDKLFELGNDATPILNLWKTTRELDVLDVQHNGYERLSNPVIHRRQFYFAKSDGFWLVRDRLEGTGRHELEWFFHFGPAIEVSMRDRLTVETCCRQGANLLVQAFTDSELTMTMKEGWISPSYGVKERGWVIRYSCSADLPQEVEFILYPYKSNDVRVNSSFPPVSSHILKSLRYAAGNFP